MRPRLREEAVFWLLLVAAAGILTCTVSEERHDVGGSKGWAPNVNYTVWASHENFYVGDWLCKFKSYSVTASSRLLTSSILVNDVVAPVFSNLH